MGERSRADVTEVPTRAVATEMELQGQPDALVVSAEEEEEAEVVKVTPLPFKQMAALSLVLLSESVCSTMLLPFVALYVTHLQHYEDPNQAGRFSGILVGCFMAGSVASSKLWGSLSDTYGRRPPMIVGLFAGGVAMLLFGVAPNVYICCLLRFAHGFCNGNVLVAKTVIADVTDKTNEAKGFALVSIMWGTGSCIGPAIGGFLYDPAKNPKLQWAHVSTESFFGRNPAFLPSLVLFFYTMTSLVVTFVVLKETNVHRKPLSSSKLIQFLARHVPCLSRYRRDTATDVVVSAAQTEFSAVAVAEEGSGATESARDKPLDVQAATRSSVAAAEGRSNPAVSLSENGEATAVAATPPKRPKLTYMQVLRITPTRNITIFYVLISASDMTFLEILPLWGVAGREVGGLAYFSDRVATILLLCSIPSVVANLYFHAICGLLKNNYVLFWLIATGVYTVNTLIVPQGHYWGPNSGLFFIIAVGIVRQVGLSWAYSLIHMLTAQSAPPGAVGATYGVSQSFASMTRCVVPFFVAPLFAWSIAKPRPFPFNFNLLFIFSALCAAAAFALSFFVRITRNASDDAVDAAIAAEVAAAAVKNREAAASRHGSTCGRTTVASVVGESLSDDDSDDSGVRGAYFSLVASFCTNPVQDAYIPLAALERANQEGRDKVDEEQQAQQQLVTAVETPDEQGDDERTRNVSHSGDDTGSRDNTPFQPPSRSVPRESVQPASPNSGKKAHVIRARTADLLKSLRGQQVEGSRVVSEPTNGDMGRQSSRENSVESQHCVDETKEMPSKD